MYLYVYVHIDNTISMISELLVKEKILIPETFINECDSNGILLFFFCIASSCQKLSNSAEVLRADAYKKKLSSVS